MGIYQRGQGCGTHEPLTVVEVFTKTTLALTSQQGNMDRGRAPKAPFLVEELQAVMATNGRSVILRGR